MSPMQDVGDLVINPSVMQKPLIKRFLLYFYLKTLCLGLLNYICLVENEMTLER